MWGTSGLVVRRRVAAGLALALLAILIAVPGIGEGGRPDVARAAEPQPYKPGIPDETEARARAQRSIEENGAKVRTSPGETHTVTHTIIDTTGASHVRYERTYRGLPVLRGGFVVHNAPGGTFAGVSVGLGEAINVDIRPKVSAKQATEVAIAAFEAKGGKESKAGEPRLIVEAYSGVGRLAWEITIGGRASDGMSNSRSHVSVDAYSGAVIVAIKGIAHGSGNGFHSGAVTINTTLSGGDYRMVDSTHGNAITCDAHQLEDNLGPPVTPVRCDTFTSAIDTWGDGTAANRESAAVDAHYGMAMTYDYLKSVHGRDGIFGDGRGVTSRVHYGNQFDNAFWDPDLKMVAFGDGHQNAHPWTALDVVGHELSHGMTEELNKLVNAGESGGLNESTSDIFGTMVEFYAGRGDYTFGEKIYGTPFRRMYDPQRDGGAACWYSGVGNLDDHDSAGVGNLFFFMLAEGSGNTAYGTATPCPGKPAVTGISRQKAEKIWYTALKTYFTDTTEYVDQAQTTNDSARAHTLSAATDLHGLCSTEYKAVQTAWTAVNVAGKDEACPQPPQNVWAQPQSNGTILVAWDPDPQAAWYEVQMLDVTAGETVHKPIPAPDPTKAFLEVGLLTHDHEYEFRVITRNHAGGPSDPSTPVRARSHYDPPRAPANLRATPGTDGSIALAWDAVDTGVYHLVYQRDITEDPSAEFAQMEYPVDGTTLNVTYLLHDHTYEYKIAATNQGGEGPPSNVVTATARYTAPSGAPGNLRATPGDGQVTLDWDPVGTDTWYWIYFRDRTAEDADFVKAEYPVADGTTVTMGWLHNGHDYEFKVTAFNQAGESPASNVVQAKPVPPLPAKPTALTASAQSDGSIKLTWTAPGEGLWYWVYMQDVTAGQAWTKLPYPVTEGPAFTSSGLTHGHTYRFKVAGTNLAGDGPQTDPVQAVSSYLPPPAPTDLRGSTAGDGSIDLSWDAPAESLHYWIWMRDATAGQAWTKLPYPLTETSFSAGSLVNGHAYEFKVTAQNQGGVGPASAVVRVTSLGGLPAAPTGLRATPGDGKVQLAWTASPGAGSYWIHVRDKTANQSFKRLQYPVNTTSFSVTLLTNGHTYEFKVTASNASGDSKPSTVVSARPMPPLAQPPTNLTATAGDGIVNLRWNASPTANVWYWIEMRDATANQGWQRLKYPVDVTSFTARYLWNGHTYQFRVRANNLSGDSAPTAAASAKPMPPFPQAPSGLTATPADGLVNLRWNASPTANTWYWIEMRDATTNQGWQRLKYPVKATSFAARYLWNGHTYQFRIRATNLAGDSAPTAVVSAKPMPAFPQAPTNLTATASSQAVRLTWQASATRGVLYWIEMRDETRETAWQRLRYPVNVTSLPVIWLTNGHYYQFRVRATNLSGDSAPSNVVTAMPYAPIPSPPDAPPHSCVKRLAVDGYWLHSDHSGWEAQVASITFKDCPVVVGRDRLYLEREMGPNNWSIWYSIALDLPSGTNWITHAAGCAQNVYWGHWRARAVIGGRTYYSASQWCPRF